MEKTALTPDQLLQPRYKVIADYPNRPMAIPIGHILTLDKFGAGKWWHEYTDNEPIHIDEGSERFPAILSKMEWWEDRQPGELPQYMKSEYYNKVIKCEWRTYEGGIQGRSNINDEWIDIESCVSFQSVPATETEFITYQNSIK